MAKITKPSWLGDRTYAKKATYPDDDLEHLIMSTLSKVNVLYDEIAANNQKVGISSSQANAITANTAKTGISTSQADAITANTAKTGITTTQADAITANTAKTGISTAQANLITGLNQGVPQAVSTTTKGVTATIIPRVVVGKTNALELSIRLSNGQVYATSLALTRIK